MTFCAYLPKTDLLHLKAQRCEKALLPFESHLTEQSISIKYGIDLMIFKEREKETEGAHVWVSRRQWASILRGEK